MNHTVIPSSFPSPAAPDFYECDNFYASPFKPAVVDCGAAFNLLPRGANNITWTIDPQQGEEWGLPYVVTHGTCQLQFQACGEAAHDLHTIEFAPNDLRMMAGWVIDQCVRGELLGGYTTRKIANTLDYVTDAMTFHEDPFPTDTTFLSLLVWNADVPDPNYNPGDMDPSTGYTILEAIRAAYSREPEGPMQVNIERNYEFFRGTVQAMDRSLYRTWWNSPPDNLVAANTSLTDRIGNFTLPANSTLPVPETINLTHACGTVTQQTTDDCADLGGGGASAS
ncbi:hypothetical protein ABVK25_005154 [Lepraria finkii]|uniref:Uncharacterized protein n=1 Tax=Lepraria finkii TaxID=1340010 RepID=A0ABR4BC45_9LECA